MELYFRLVTNIILVIGLIMVILMARNNPPRFLYNNRLLTFLQWVYASVAIANIIYMVIMTVNFFTQ